MTTIQKIKPASKKEIRLLKQLTSKELTRYAIKHVHADKSGHIVATNGHAMIVMYNKIPPSDKDTFFEAIAGELLSVDVKGKFPPWNKAIDIHRAGWDRFCVTAPHQLQAGLAARQIAIDAIKYSKALELFFDIYSGEELLVSCNTPGDPVYISAMNGGNTVALLVIYTLHPNKNAIERRRQEIIADYLTIG
jgi:hypothetical protein